MKKIKTTFVIILVLIVATCTALAEFIGERIVWLWKLIRKN